MPTPTRGCKLPLMDDAQVCDETRHDGSECDSDINSITSDNVMNNIFSLPYDNLGDLEKEQDIELDPRTIHLSLESMPIIMLTILKQLETTEGKGDMT